MSSGTSGAQPVVRPRGQRWALPRLAPGASVSRLGSRNLRLRPWLGSGEQVMVSPGRFGPLPKPHHVHQLKTRLAGTSVREVFTPALNWREAEPFLAADFEISEHLHLLSLRLISEPPRLRTPITTARRQHHRRVLQIDHGAFDQFWRFDQVALKSARRATPSSAFRVALDDSGDPIGYAITGRAGHRGYLQRLAVAPWNQGRGVATGLVYDGLRWLWNQRVSLVMVNTQQTNTRALDLYERLGFEREQQGLMVLRWVNPSPSP